MRRASYPSEVDAQSKSIQWLEIRGGFHARSIIFSPFFSTLIPSFPVTALCCRRFLLMFRVEDREEDRAGDVHKNVLEIESAFPLAGDQRALSTPEYGPCQLLRFSPQLSSFAKSSSRSRRLLFPHLNRGARNPCARLRSLGRLGPRAGLGPTAVVAAAAAAAAYLG